MIIFGFLTHVATSGVIRLIRPWLIETSGDHMDPYASNEMTSTEDAVGEITKKK